MQKKMLAEKIALIKQLDLDCVLRKLCASFENGGYEWSQKDALAAIEAYRDFLIEVLKKTDPQEQLRPDRMVDVVWHTHVLFTRKYQKDCEEMFGRFIHHDPD